MRREETQISLTQKGGKLEGFIEQKIKASVCTHNK